MGNLGLFFLFLKLNKDFISRGILIATVFVGIIIFFIKMGIAVGGALGGWLLAGIGYQADVTQTAETKAGLLLAFSLYPAIGSLVVAVVMGAYKLNTQKVDEITVELKRAAE